jgi:hypothetical protein
MSSKTRASSSLSHGPLVLAHQLAQEADAARPLDLRQRDRQPLDGRSLSLQGLVDRGPKVDRRDHGGQVEQRAGHARHPQPVHAREIAGLEPMHHVPGDGWRPPEVSSGAHLEWSRGEAPEPVEGSRGAM